MASPGIALREKAKEAGVPEADFRCLGAIAALPRLKAIWEDIVNAPGVLKHGRP